MGRPHRSMGEERVFSVPVSPGPGREGQPRAMHHAGEPVRLDAPGCGGRGCHLGSLGEVLIRICSDLAKGAEEASWLGKEEWVIVQGSTLGAPWGQHGTVLPAGQGEGLARDTASRK